MPLKRPLIFLIAVCATLGLAAGCYWASLLISLERLEAGIRERNVAMLEKAIDWVIIRDQLRSQIRGTALRRFYEDALGKQEKPGYFLGALLAGTIAPAMLDQFVDGFVTSEGLVDLLGKDPDHKERNGITISRTGFTDLDEYTIQLSKGAADPAKTITAVLRRQGTIWRVVRVEFPPGKAPWEASEPPWTGLKIEKLVPSRTPEGLVIDGDIVNNGGMTQDLPRLRVALRDASEKEVQFKIVDPPQPRLAPGAVAHFKTPFDHPDDAAKGVVVTFAHIPSSDNKTLASGRTDDPAPARSAAASKPDQRNSISKSEAPQQIEKPERSAAADAKPEAAAQPKAPLGGSRLTESELDMVRHQIARCWNVPAEARHAKGLVVEIKIVVDPDGTVRQAMIVDQARLSSDSFFRAAAESARRAFFNPQCRPLHLPTEKYAIWKDFIIDFSPKDLL